MYRIPGVLSAATTPAPAVPRVRPTRDPPPGNPQAPEHGCATGPAEAIPGQAEDRERIAGGLNDVVVHRLLTAGLDLQTALGLMGDHPASGKICHAVDELDQAIRDIRDTIFDHPAGEGPPSDTSTNTT
jgi:Histidine kinase